jgi:heme exporter protein B
MKRGAVSRYIASVIAVVRKDILTELRTREVITAMLVFAVMALVIFSFALRTRAENVRALGPGVLWATLVFAGTLGLNRSMSSEQINQCMDGLLLAPCDRSMIFVGKALTNVIFMLLVAALAAPIAAMLFDEALIQPGVMGVIVLGVIGYAGAGTLIATMAANTRAREVFLPILLFPLALPLMTSTVMATAGIVDRLPFADFGIWIGVVFAFIAIFWTAGTLLFEFLVEG